MRNNKKLTEMKTGFSPIETAPQTMGQRMENISKFGNNAKDKTGTAGNYSVDSQNTHIGRQVASGEMPFVQKYNN